jgi:DNA-binding transcriptional ArsR family regulator
MHMALMNQTFAALADPTRRGIIARLAEGEATVSELVDRFDLTQPTISSHLKVLETAGLISRSRRGQTRPCKLEPDGLKAITGWLEHLQTVWETNFARLDDLLEELKVKKPQKKER